MYLAVTERVVPLALWYASLFELWIRHDYRIARDQMCAREYAVEKIWRELPPRVVHIFVSCPALRTTLHPFHKKVSGGQRPVHTAPSFRLGHYYKLGPVHLSGWMSFGL